MKKSVLVIGLCLILLSAASYSVHTAARRVNFGLLGGGNMETKTFDITEDFRNIRITADTEDIEFRPSDSGKCRVVCVERENDWHTVSVSDKTLTVERVNAGKWFRNISLFSLGKQSITVYLPKSEYADLFIDDDTGDVAVPQDFTFDSVEITVSTGDVACGASASGLLRIKTSTGDILTENVSAGELDLKVSTGRVDLQSVDCGGNVNVVVSTGKAQLTDVACRSLSSTGSTGSIALQNVIAETTMSVKRSTGNVSFDRCDAGELLIETDTGKVSGTLLSDKVFLARSDTGHIDVPETLSGGRCKISTDTGSIKMEIL